MKLKTVKRITATFLTAAMVFSCVGVTYASDEDVTPRTVAEREDADEGVSLTPTSFTEEQLPGVPYVGAVPTKKYKIAFSNGDMQDSWRAAFYDDMIESLEYLSEEFGIEYITANSGADSAKQIEDIRSLLAQEPDILLFSPNESAPLAVVADMCEEAGVPFITIDRSIDATVGEGMYIADIEGDNYKDGIAMGISIVNALTEKYGEAKGTVAEICGTVGSSVGEQRSGGIRTVLQDYPDIKIVQVLDGQFDDATAHDAAQDIFTTWGDELDLLVSAVDTGCAQAMEVASTMGYDDIIYVCSNGNVSFLQDYLLTGKAYSVIEYPPYYGVTALEYAIHYLNGYDIPTQVLLAQRNYMIDTEEKEAALQELVEESVANGNDYVPASLGMYDVFACEGELWDTYYPESYIEAGGQEYLDSVIPDDPFSLINAD
ncbi:MAG: substrate-binding domain-containing protein [Lachnospiraceae bacterium]|nr:substrate-binding domain-containing protein [Lachnospiraceae bacterium]